MAIRTISGFSTETSPSRISVGIPSMAALLHLVSHVVLVRSEKEMIWPDAPRRIAPMENQKSVRNRAIDEFPCEAMSRYHAIPHWAEFSITISSDCFLPQPTAIATFIRGMKTLVDGRSDIERIPMLAPSQVVHVTKALAKSPSAATFDRAMIPNGFVVSEWVAISYPGLIMLGAEFASQALRLSAIRNTTHGNKEYITSLPGQ